MTTDPLFPLGSQPYPQSQAFTFFSLQTNHTDSSKIDCPTLPGTQLCLNPLLMVKTILHRDQNTHPPGTPHIYHWPKVIYPDIKSSATCREQTSPGPVLRPVLLIYNPQPPTAFEPFHMLKAPLVKKPFKAHLSAYYTYQTLSTLPFFVQITHSPLELLKNISWPPTQTPQTFPSDTAPCRVPTAPQSPPETHRKDPSPNQQTPQPHRIIE